MPSTTVGHTQIAAAWEDLVGPHSSLQLALIAQSAPVVIVEMSSTTCMTAHSPIAAATSLCAMSGLGTPTTSLGVTAKTATPRLLATLLQVEGFMRRVENNPSPTRIGEVHTNDSAGLFCDLQSSLTGSLDE